MIGYDPGSALLIVDVQNDFADPDGSLSVAGGAEIIGRINEEVQLAFEASATIVYTQDWHPPSTPHFETDGGPWPVHCVQDSWGAELHPQLQVAGERIRKGQHGEDGYSAFSMRDAQTGEERPTELEQLLRDRGVGRVIICGLATDYCVRASALDAQRLGFDTTLLTDAVAAVDLEPGDGERALAEMAAAGVHLELHGV